MDRTRPPPNLSVSLCNDSFVTAAAGTTKQLFFKMNPAGILHSKPWLCLLYNLQFAGVGHHFEW